jgi:Spy/CpxP family protein refolding chaperone
MSRKKMVLVAVVALLVGFAAFALSAQSFEKRFERPRSGVWDQTSRFERVAQFLELDADQAEQWLQIVENEQSRSVLRHDEIVDLRSRFRDQAESDTPDLESLGQIALDVYHQLEASRQDHEQMKSELESILTPEQLDRFEALEAARGFSGPKHRGPGQRAGLHQIDG